MMTPSASEVAFGIAFLMMGMVHESLDVETNAVFNRYLYRMNDASELRAVPY
mgnify:CR=1 FL=1